MRAFLILTLSHYAYSWNRDMPGGMKLGINGKTYGFTTDLCSGGVFFKAPVDLDFMCTHGYFLRRSNGCRIHGNDVVSGSRYVCKEGKHVKKSIQALIPLTNPDAPLDHTITFFDDADTLDHFRRYTYSHGLENQYEGEDLADAAGVIVTNSHKTPLTSIGNLCYQGKSSAGSTYIAKFHESLKNGDSNGFFARKCSAKSTPFPWSKAHHYHFSEGYSSQLEFKNEIPATPSALALLSSKMLEDTSKYEIWGGLAYCLQGNHVKGKDLKLSMKGLTPPISSLKSHCSHKGHSRKTRDLVPMEIVEGTALARIARADSEYRRIHSRQADDAAKGAKGDASSSESGEVAEPPESALLGCVMSCNGQAMNKIPPMFAARQFSMG